MKDSYTREESIIVKNNLIFARKDIEAGKATELEGGIQRLLSEAYDYVIFLEECLADAHKEFQRYQARIDALEVTTRSLLSQIEGIVQDKETFRAALQYMIYKQ